MAPKKRKLAKRVSTKYDGADSVAIAKLWSVKAMIEDAEYSGFRLMLMTDRTGWRVFIYGPNSKLLPGEMPSTIHPAGRTAVMDEARQIVDRLLQSN